MTSKIGNSVHLDSVFLIDPATTSALNLERHHPLADTICRGLITIPIVLTLQGTFVTSVVRDTPPLCMPLRRYQMSNQSGRQLSKFVIVFLEVERFLCAEGSGGVSRLGT